MKLENKWLIASDIDGTLLDSHGLIPKRNIQAIQSFVDAGGLFTIATGRSVNAIRHIIEQIEYNCPIIVLNGTAIYDYAKEAYIWEHTLSGSAKKIVKQVLKKFPKIGLEIYIGTRVIIPFMNALVAEQMEYERLIYEEMLLAEVPQDWLKVIFVGNEQEIDAVSSYLATLNYHEAEFVRSAYCFYEMLPMGCSKGIALHHLAELCGIHKECTAAIGDYFNDIELLRAAAFPAAAGQAPEAVLALAELKTCHCDEGSVADLLEYIADKKL